MACEIWVVGGDANTLKPLRLVGLLVPHHASHHFNSSTITESNRTLTTAKHSWAKGEQIYIRKVRRNEANKNELHTFLEK